MDISSKVKVLEHKLWEDYMKCLERMSVEPLYHEEVEYLHKIAMVLMFHSQPSVHHKLHGHMPKPGHLHVDKHVHVDATGYMAEAMGKDKKGGGNPY